jgi:hypothetical protein
MLFTSILIDRGGFSIVEPQWFIEYGALLCTMVSRGQSNLNRHRRKLPHQRIMKDLEDQCWTSVRRTFALYRHKSLEELRCKKANGLMEIRYFGRREKLSGRPPPVGSPSRPRII